MEIIELTESNINKYLDDCLELQSYLVKAGEPILAEQFKATAGNQQTYFIGVVDEGKLVGMGVINLIVHPVRTNSYVDNIVVHPDTRGKGLFSLIMNDLETKSKEWGCSRIYLSCSREAVQGMYEKRGYQEKDTKFYSLDI